MNIYKDWKAKLESVYSFMSKYFKITVCPLFQIEGNLIYFEFVCFFPKKESNWQTDLNAKRLVLQISVAMSLSLS